MSLTRRITGGLAWAGLALFVAVPVADFVTDKMMGDGDTSPQALNVSTTSKPIVLQTKAIEKVAAVESPVLDSPAIDLTANPVDRYLSAGKKLPSYLSGEDADVAGNKPVSRPVVVQPEAEVAAVPAKTPVVTPIDPAPAGQVAIAPPTDIVVTDPVETASIQPELVAPVPMPYEMRPRSVEVGYRQPGDSLYIPPTNDNTVVTADDLSDWEFGPLSDFLARRQAANGDAAQAQPVDTYDPDGYYLSDGPNSGPQGSRYIGPVDEPGFFPFLD